MAVSLELGPGLVVSRVQQEFSHHRMYHTAGTNLLSNVDALTRYDPRLYQKITKEFYSPPWLRLPIKEQPITPVGDMVAVADPFLPYLCKKQMLFTYQGGGPMPGLLAAEEDPSRGVSTTGSGWRSNPICQNPCLACNTGKATHPQDTVLLQQVEVKKEIKKKKKAKGLLASTLPSTAGSPGTLAALGLSVENAMKPRKLRRPARGARSGLTRTFPLPTDSNPFQHLLAGRWGYLKAVRTLATCLKWLPKEAGPPMDRALKAIFRGERINSASFGAEGRRGNTAFSLEEIEGIVVVRGRDMDQGEPGSEPSLVAQDAHRLFDEQLTAYLVPLLHSSTALALAVIQEVHIGHCGESEAVLAARVSQYFHLSGHALVTCRKVCDSCHGCKRVCGKPGRDKIRRLRHIGPADLQEGSSVLIDTAGYFLVYLQARQVGATHTRTVASGARRITVKRWILLAVDAYSHRLECSELEDMSTHSVVGALNEIFAASGWKTTRLCLDPGSSLAPAASQAMTAGADPEQADDSLDEELQEGARQRLVAGLKQQGYHIRPCYAKSPWRQAKVESTVKSFKKVLYSSLKPGTTDLTVSSFGRAMRLCAAMVNGRPVVLLPEGGRHPDEGMLCSPTSLRGPSHSQWTSAAASRDARGQYGIIKALEARFQKNWVTHYSRRLRTNTKLDRSSSPTASWPPGSIVLILDLPGRSGRLHPHPRLGRIEKYLDEEKNHAWVAYAGPHGQAYVDRPLGKLVYLTSSMAQVPGPGLFFDPLLEGDREALRADGDDDEQPEAAADEGAGAEAAPRSPLPQAVQATLPQATAEQPGAAAEEEAGAATAPRSSPPHAVPVTTPQATAEEPAGPRRSTRQRRNPARFRE